MGGGLRFNSGKEKWSLVSWRALTPMVQVLMYGAHKYSKYKMKNGLIIKGSEAEEKDCVGFEVFSSGADNWKGGLKYTEICESLQRHLYAFMEGEDNDSESKLSHVGHILCNAMFLSWMIIFRSDLDDRRINRKTEKDEGGH